MGSWIQRSFLNEAYKQGYAEIVRKKYREVRLG